MNKICFKCRNKLKENHKYGLCRKCFIEWFECEENDEFETITPEQILESSELNRELAYINSSFFQGKYKKYSASLKNDKYIFKVKEIDYPNL
jgi:hypothetical protein